MKNQILRGLFVLATLFFFILCPYGCFAQYAKKERPRVIATTDGEIDDQCSMVRFLLYSNEFDVAGIILSSSQYHWRGHDWAGDNWLDGYVDAYEKVYSNLVQHDENYPAPEYLRSVTFVGNVTAEGEMDSVTQGSQHIVNVLLDTMDDRPIWLQAWGGPNTIARALKTIEEQYPDRMEEVAKKIRLFMIWEQDSTYQAYIRPHWGKYNILTIISDQFEAIAYRWKKIVPEECQSYLEAEWIEKHILKGHGPLCSLYHVHEKNDGDYKKGDFLSEGDSPSFLHNIITGLRNMEHPDWGGWGGRYVRVYENVFIDPVPEIGYKYPNGRWYANTAWGCTMLGKGFTSFNNQMVRDYYKSIWRWVPAIQNDFAARADWCVKSYDEANHPPVVKVDSPINIVAEPGDVINLSAKKSYDPDGNELSFYWWQYKEADSYEGEIEIKGKKASVAKIFIPKDVEAGETIHVICEATDNGNPPLTRYQRIVITVKN